MAGTIAKAADAQQIKAQNQKPGVNALLSSVLDGEKMRSRFEEILGKRTPQFMSSLVTLVNANEGLQKCMYDDPMSVVQAALRAAMYDLPIDPNLGYAWLIPSKNTVNRSTGEQRWQARFQLGYKGQVQLALRTGVYDRIPSATDVREGELVRYDRLRGEAEFSWIDDEEEREKRPVIGYAAYFRLKNGAEATLYMSRQQIERHEKKFRQGSYQGKGWRDDWDAMARKTVLSDLLRHKGLMSIEYRSGADDSLVKLAQSVMEDDPEDPGQTVASSEDSASYASSQPPMTVDPNTGEVMMDAE